MNIKDFKWTEKRFGTTFANILKKLGGLSKDGTDGSIEYKDDQGNVTKLVTDSNFSSLLAKNGLIEVKWQELKDKRDNGQLIPGSLYRITDYNCTTTQENTQSAGHQFDIVLLALSEDKLAEEGWAMMNESNIYEVTFNDGVTKKCYLYYDLALFEGSYTLVAIDTLLGINGLSLGDEIESIDEEKRSAVCTYMSTDLQTENLTYNYFQNSNLSAWKVWYCLDNDKSRFAWADDSVDASVEEAIVCTINNVLIKYYRNSLIDDHNTGGNPVYGWSYEGSDIVTPNSVYTLTLEIVPSVTKALSSPIGRPNINIDEYTPAHEGTGLPNGRGVIYRLIDEWGNDVPYDFKNIQFVRKLTDGEYDADNGTDTWCYTFSNWDLDNSSIYDISLKYNEEYHALNNKVSFFPNNDDENIKISDNVFLYLAESNTLKQVGGCTFKSCSNDDVCCCGACYFATSYSIYRNCYINRFSFGGGSQIWINDKKVLTEE